MKLFLLRSSVIFSLLVSTAAAEMLSADDPRIQKFETQLMDRESRSNPGKERFTIQQRLDHYGVPGVSVAIIENGQVVWARGYGVKQAGTDKPVDADTVFSAGSVSKMINAALILRLVQEGTLDLDTDVNQYLTSWNVPASIYSESSPVTLRTILSHTAGFSVHGFADYYPGEPLPTPLQTLDGLSPAKNPPVVLMFSPGERMDYSGGGITVSQQLVEDITGADYESAARGLVFEPLGMSRSTFQNPLSPDHGNIALAHDGNGEPRALPRGWEAMPELAASGLWVSANDLGAFVIALMGKEPKDFLDDALLEDMLTRETNSWHGLGPRLNGEGETFVFHHGGANNSYRAWMEGHPTSGNGIVILTNGADGASLRSELRKSAEDAFDWPVKSEDGFEEPEL